MPARIRPFRGRPAVGLSGGDYEATFLPELGMLGAALRWRGAQLLSLHGGLEAWSAGHTTGMPLLAPWANRLDGPAYRVGRTVVDLRRAPRVHTDGNGLPIHGTMLGPRGWEVVSVLDEPDRGWLQARFDYTDGVSLRSFPFPHRLTVAVDVRRGGISVETVVEPRSARGVPVSFGWHPYFRLPGGARSEWSVRLPPSRRLVLDDHQIPTGARVRDAGGRIPLRGRAFDDGYALGRDRRFELSDPDRRLTVVLGDGYPFAQVYAPSGRPFVAIEPMTAPTNALVTGEHETLRRAGVYQASFSVRASPARLTGG